MNLIVYIFYQSLIFLIFFVISSYLHKNIVNMFYYNDFFVKLMIIYIIFYELTYDFKIISIFFISFFIIQSNVK
jgi:hypothetical protein